MEVEIDLLCQQYDKFLAQRNFAIVGVIRKLEDVYTRFLCQCCVEDKALPELPYPLSGIPILLHIFYEPDRHDILVAILQQVTKANSCPSLRENINMTTSDDRNLMIAAERAGDVQIQQLLQ